jgi:hypothetical protein
LGLHMNILSLRQAEIDMDFASGRV